MLSIRHWFAPLFSFLSLLISPYFIRITFATSLSSHFNTSVRSSPLCKSDCFWFGFPPFVFSPYYFDLFSRQYLSIDLFSVRVCSLLTWMRLPALVHRRPLAPLSTFDLVLSMLPRTTPDLPSLFLFSFLSYCILRSCSLLVFTSRRIQTPFPLSTHSQLFALLTWFSFFRLSPSVLRQTRLAGRYVCFMDAGRTKWAEERR
jgi:hypothetical protein